MPYHWTRGCRGRFPCAEMAYAMPGLHVLRFLYIKITGHEAHFDKCIGPIQHRLLQNQLIVSQSATPWSPSCCTPQEMHLQAYSSAMARLGTVLMVDKSTMSTVPQLQCIIKHCSCGRKHCLRISWTDLNTGQHSASAAKTRLWPHGAPRGMPSVAAGVRPECWRKGQICQHCTLQCRILVFLFVPAVIELMQSW